MPQKLTLQNVADRYADAINGPLYQALLDRGLDPLAALALALVFANAVEIPDNEREPVPRPPDPTTD